MGHHLTVNSHRAPQPLSEIPQNPIMRRPPMTENTFYGNSPTYGQAVAITALRPNAPGVTHETSETTSVTPIYAKILDQPDFSTNQLQ